MDSVAVLLSAPSLLLAAATLAARLAAMSWLEMVLWVGMASLTLALLILMLTRWGQVRPVSKCVALSVFAHLLFLTYAYGTKLQLSGIGLGRETTFAIRLVADDGEGPVAATAESTDVLVEPPPAETVPSLVEPPASFESPPQLLANAAETPAPMEASEDPVAAPPADVAVPAQEMAALPSPPPPATEPAADDPAEVSPSAEELVASTPPASLPAVEEPKSPAGDSTPVEAETPPVQNVSAVAQAAEVPPDERPMPQPEAAKTTEPSAPSSPVPDVSATVRPAPRDVPAPPDVPDTATVPETYRLRNAENRLQLAIPWGATPETEQGVLLALQWLASAQSPDGRWDASAFGAGRETRALGEDRQGAGETADTGITGLALLAFLGAGETHLAGEHADTVARGLEYLLREQARDGNLAGSARLFERMYCHGIASLALGEAYALTRDRRLEPAIRRAVQYTVTSQHPIAGGWRYQPGDRGDLSQFGWQVMALRSAELGGIIVDTATRERMLKFLSSTTTGRSQGLASYRPGERPTRTMTAEAMSCRFFLGTPPSATAAQEATEAIMSELPGRGTMNLYYWYYATLALFQDQGRAWPIWNDSLRKTLVSRQRQEGALAGSWDTDDVWGGYGGRIYTTAMATLCLEVYYRYLPVYGLNDDTRSADTTDPSQSRRR